MIGDLERTLGIRLDVKGMSELQKINTALALTQAARKRGAIDQQTEIRLYKELDEKLKGVAARGADVVRVYSKLSTAQSNSKVGFVSMGQEMRHLNMVSMNFSRVMQDIPFGLMAIQNNIEPLLLSMRELKVEAARTGQSFKSALLTAFIGPGALIGALSMALPLLSAMAKEFGNLKDRSDGAGTAIMEARRKMGLTSDRDWSKYVEGQLSKQQKKVGDAADMGIWDYMMRMFGPIGFAQQQFYRTTKMGEATRGLTETASNYGLGNIMMGEVGAYGGVRYGWTRQAANAGYWTPPGMAAFLPGEVGGIPGGMGMGRRQRLGYDTSLLPVNINVTGKYVSPMTSGMGSGRLSRLYPYTNTPTASKDELTTQRWKTAALAAGDQLSDALTRGFQEAFANGTDLLKSFGEAILSTIMGIAGKQVAVAGISGLLSLIPGVGSFSFISNALGGLFGDPTAKNSTGGVPTIASGGGETVSGKLDRLITAVESERFVAKGTDLYRISESGRLLMTAR